MTDRGGWSILLGVAVGSAAGGVARHLLTEAVVRLTSGVLPWGTILVNVSGSLAIGALTALASEAPSGWPPVWRHAVVTGLLGGYTTFSAFSAQTLLLLQQGHMLAAAGNLTLSVLLGLLACWAGFAMAGGVSR